MRQCDLIVFVLLTDVNHETERPNCFRFTDGLQSRGRAA